MKVTFAGSAVWDLEQMVTYYEDQGSPDVGRRIINEVLERVETLQDHPDMGRVVPEFDTPSLRELIQPPFRIVYRREPELVRIVRVWRGERMLDLAPD